MSRKKELKQLLARNAFKTLFEELGKLVPASETLLLNRSRYNDLEEQNAQGVIQPGDYDIGIARVRKALVGVIDSLTEEDQEREPVHEFHKYTCDRVEQCDAFDTVYKEIQDRKTQFYYIYGWEPHSPSGLFKRFAFDLEGKFYLPDDQQGTCQSFKREVAFEESNNLERYKENILKELFSEFGISPNNEGPLLEKNLQYLWENSPSLKEYQENDFVCIFLSIYDFDWNPDVTPMAVKWFIEEFCKGSLPANAPQFLFFFGIIYEEEDPEMEEEVMQAIRFGKHVKILPELTPVNSRHITKWFTRYKVLAPTSRDRRKLIDQHFEGKEFLMEDVEIELEKIIDNYNKGLL
jgi:hypothetical protein